MKIIKLNLFLILVFTFGLLTFSCSDKIVDSNVDSNPLDTAHFDIWVSIGGTSGMGSENTLLVQNTKLLEGNDTIDFLGKGVDVTAKLYQESIIKGQYYYQIPKEKDRFGKYRIGTSGIEIVKEVAFGTNTYKDRRYTHAWINDSTFVVLAANGNSDHIIWTKLNSNTMTIVSEGTLDLPVLSKYSTSGIASYRASDNKIIYSYCHGTTSLRTEFYTAFINPTDMSVDTTVTETRAQFMAGTAYGELLQSKSFFDDNGDYYLACNSTLPNAASSTEQRGTLLRIKKGETKFDQSYTGFQEANHPYGKIVTAEFLTTNKALLYIQDPLFTSAAGWGDDYNCYYAILDLTTDNLTALDLPYNEGTFSQLSVVLGNKAYIGVNAKDEAPAIYIYDIATGLLTKGKTIAEGYSFDRIVTLLD